MMAAHKRTDRLIDRLPAVRGRYREDVALDRVTWFRVGGPAEVVFRPADEDDLAGFLAAKPADVPVMALGVGSNVLVRDGGVWAASSHGFRSRGSASRRAPRRSTSTSRARPRRRASAVWNSSPACRVRSAARCA